MVNYSFKRTIVFVSIILLLFASFVYAKRPISEEDLDQITAETGVTLGLNLNAQMSATSLGIYQTSAEAEGLFISSLAIKDADDNDAFSVVTNVIMDVGSSGTRTWLNMSGLNFPNQAGNLPMNYTAPNAVSIMTTGIQAKDSATTTYTLADSLQLYGMYTGKNVNLWTSGTDYCNFTPNTTFVRVSPRAGGSGINLVAEAGLLLRLLIIRPNNTDTHRFWIDGLILSENTNSFGYDATADPAGWPNLSGNAKMGGSVPTYNYSFDNSNGAVTVTQNGYKETAWSFDVGSSGTSTILQLNLPAALSIHWKHMYADQGSGRDVDLGSSVVNNLVFYKAQLTVRNTY